MLFESWRIRKKSKKDEEVQRKEGDDKVCVSGWISALCTGRIERKTKRERGEEEEEDLFTVYEEVTESR